MENYDSDIKRIAEEVEQFGYNPVNIFLAAVEELKSKDRRGGVRSCLTCISQNKCEGKDNALHFANSVTIYSNSSDKFDYSGLIFSIAAQRCCDYSIINDPIFTGKMPKTE